MVVSKTMPSRYKKGRAEIPRHVKHTFTYPYFEYFLKVNGYFTPIEEFVFYGMTLEQSFRKALKMEADLDPLFIKVRKWLDEEATA